MGLDHVKAWSDLAKFLASVLICLTIKDKVPLFNNWLFHNVATCPESFACRCRHSMVYIMVTGIWFVHVCFRASRCRWLPHRVEDSDRLSREVQGSRRLSFWKLLEAVERFLKWRTYEEPMIMIPTCWHGNQWINGWVIHGYPWLSQTWCFLRPQSHIERWGLHGGSAVGNSASGTGSRFWPKPTCWHSALRIRLHVQ